MSFVEEGTGAVVDGTKLLPFARRDGDLVGFREGSGEGVNFVLYSYASAAFVKNCAILMDVLLCMSPAIL